MEFTTKKHLAPGAMLPFDEGDLRTAGRVRHLLLATDGSSRAMDALPLVRAFGAAAGADVDTVEVPDEDPVDGLVARFGYGDEVLGCIATHGRDRSSALVGSVAQGVLDRVDRPVLLAGPSSAWNDDPRDPVVVAVDGSAADAVVTAVAAGWSERLHRPLHLVTVVEPAPDGVTGRAPRRSHGPDDPEAHIASLAAFTHGHGVETTAAVIEDPVMVADPVITECARVGATLVVVGAVRHRGLHRIVLGSHAARIVRGSPALVLAVPLGGRS